ncbi:MAG: SLC13 family permease [Christensenellales bacterium]
MEKIIALILFALTFVLLLALPRYRINVALISAAVFVLSGIMPYNKVLQIIDYNVIMMIAGTMGIVSLFIESNMPSLLANKLINRAGGIKAATIMLALFAGFISAFIDNVATVLMIAPVALDIAKKLNISPVTPIVAIAVSSNLQGAATLVGDTTSILLGGHAGLDFLDFFIFKGKLGIFFVVQAGAVAATICLLLLLRKTKGGINHMGSVQVKDYFPTALLVGMVTLLIGASLLPEKPSIINGLICMALFIIGLIRKAAKEGVKQCVINIKEIDYITVGLLACLFIIVGGITEVGAISDISLIFARAGNNNLFATYTIIVFASVFISAFIDNIPYVAAMLPVTAGIAAMLNVEPYILYFGLLSGATLGGNLTPIGASANIAALGILRKQGIKVTTGEFMKIGVPFTLAAVITGYILIWIIWS